jgi:CRP-like cAMP-binding protein
MPDRLKFEVFDGLPAPLVAEILAALPVLEVPKGTVVAREGQMNPRLFLVENGTLAVWKGEPNTERGLEIVRIGPGACFGEVSVLRQSPSSVSVVATCAVRLRELALHVLPDTGNARQTVTFNLARIVARRLSETDASLRRAHDVQVHTTQLVGATASYVNWNVVGLGACMFSLPAVKLLQLGISARAVLSAVFIVFAAVGAWAFARRNHVERSVLGLTYSGAVRQLRIGTLWTLPMLLVWTALKWQAARTSGAPLLEPMALGRHFGLPGVSGWLILTSAAVALSIALEFTRCAIQGALQFFFRTSHLAAGWTAIAVASIVCAALQIHLGVAFAWVNFALGMFWGSLFAKERSFFAAAVSHVTIVVWTMGFLGLPL